MSFTDLTNAQLTSDYNHITDSSAKLISLNRDGSAVLEVTPLTAEYLVRNLTVANGKPAVVSIGSAYFVAGDYEAPRLKCSLVRIVEAQSSAGEE